jgi:hypothetical protein
METATPQFAFTCGYSYPLGPDHLMTSSFIYGRKLLIRLPRPCLTTKARAATMIRRIATGAIRSANGPTRIAEMLRGEEVDGTSMEAVRIRREIWGVRNISEQLPAYSTPVSN